MTVSANASDNVGVVGVQFLRDGAPLGTEDKTFPCDVLWDTSLVTNGSHTLGASARDAAGNLGTAVAVSPAQLDYYRDELTSPLKRQTLRQRSKLFYRLARRAVAGDPVAYEAMGRRARSRRPSTIHRGSWIGCIDQSVDIRPATSGK